MQATQLAQTRLPLIKDGCEIKQLALNWQGRIDFVLLDDLSLQGIRFKDEIIQEVKEMEAETKQHQFHADFLIMTGTFDGLIKDLLSSFAEKQTTVMEPGNVVSMKKDTLPKLVSA